MSPDALDLVQQAAAQVEAELADEATGEEPDSQGEEPPPEEPAAPRDFVLDLIGAMTRLGDTLPARVPGQVTITTMHGAKGLNVDVVIVLQAEDEIIPGSATGLHLDEARRLLYVSLTRGKRKLLVTACYRRTGPQRFVGQDEVVHRTFTRFLRDYGLQALTVRQYLERADT